ncbi:MAG: hypothetical protein ACREDT_04280 [Methylocella sp.]
MTLNRRSFNAIFAAVSIGAVGGVDTLAALQAWGGLVPTPKTPGLDVDRCKKLHNIFFNGLANCPGDKVVGFVGSDLSSFVVIRSDENDGFRNLELDDDLTAAKHIMRLMKIANNFEPKAPNQTPNENVSAIFVASPFTSPWSRRVLFDSADPLNPFELNLYNRRYQLGFNFFRPDPKSQAKRPQLHRYLDGVQMAEPSHGLIVKEHKGILYSHLDNNRYPENGYLLFSMLPHPIHPERKVAIWSGNTGPATEAARLVIENLPIDDLHVLQERLEGAKYFQVLFHVDGIHVYEDSDRKKKRHVPGKVSLAKGKDYIGIHRVSEFDIG